MSEHTHGIEHPPCDACLAEIARLKDELAAAREDLVVYGDNIHAYAEEVRRLKDELAAARAERTNLIMMAEELRVEIREVRTELATLREHRHQVHFCNCGAGGRLDVRALPGAREEESA